MVEEVSCLTIGGAVEEVKLGRLGVNASTPIFVETEGYIYVILGAVMMFKWVASLWS